MSGLVNCYIILTTKIYKNYAGSHTLSTLDGLPAVVRCAYDDRQFVQRTQLHENLFLTNLVETKWQIFNF